MVEMCLVDDELAALFEHRLDADAITRANAHIATCAACRELAREHARIYEEPIAGPAPGTTCGRYVVLEPIAAGAMGVVVAAYDEALDRRVALKFLDARRSDDEAALARLEREARALARLNHPNVVAVHEYGTYNGIGFVAMELVAGTDLRAWWTGRSLAEILDVFEQAGAGLAAAHDAGLIHRDIKPENILVGSDGRVRVSDFGLARGGSSDLALGTGVDAPFELEPIALARVTRTGAIAGTPAYMAPEQRAGGEVSPAADQFSFCVTLHEAIYGVRPGESAPARRDVPAWLRRLVARGLVRDSGERFASMHELLAAIASGRRARRRRFVIAGAVALPAIAVAAAVVIARPSAIDAAAACDSGPDPLAGIWDPAARIQQQHAFLATGASFALTTWSRIEPRLGEIAARWSTARRQACVDTRVRHHESEEVFARRSVCLEQDREQLRALVQTFAAADREIVTRSVQALAAVPDGSSCLDRKLLATPPPPPGLATSVAALTATLGRVRVSIATGKWREAEKLAEALVTDTHTLGYPPLTADALYELSRVALLLAQDERASKLLYETLEAAQAAGNDAIAARCWIHLIALTHDALALDWQHAVRGAIRRMQSEAELDRTASSSELEADLASAVAEQQARAKDFASALESDQRALELQQQGGGADDYRVATHLRNISRRLVMLGRFDDAVTYQQRAHVLDEKVLGPDHPTTAADVVGLGDVYMRTNRIDEALAAYDRAGHILERALGPDHPQTIANAASRARVLAEIGRAAEAVPAIERLVADKRKRLAPDDPELASSLTILAQVMQRAKRWHDSLAPAAEAHRILAAKLGPDHPSLIGAMQAEAAGQAGLGDHLAARDGYLVLLRVVERKPMPDDSLLAATLRYLAIEQRLAGDRTGAVQSLERTVKLQVRSPVELAPAQFDLAQLLASRRATRTRARGLAGASLAAFTAAGTHWARQRATVEEWLAEQGW